VRYKKICITDVLPHRIMSGVKACDRHSRLTMFLELSSFYMAKNRTWTFWFVDSKQQ